MECKDKLTKCKKLDEWLGGVSLGEKIKSLESGRLLTCTKCNLTVFDKDKPEDRIRRRCVQSDHEHAFVESDYYIILKRGFSGIVDVVMYRFGTPEEAIIKHFKNKR